MKCHHQNRRNGKVLFPILNGENLNSSFDQMPDRWVINFFDWTLEKAGEYVDLMVIVRAKVYPERQKNKDKQRREVWWRFTRPTVKLYETIAPLRRVLVLALTSKTCAFVFVSNKIVFSHAIGVFAFDNAKFFAILQSSIHVEWAWKHGSSLKGDLRYTPRDVFETFPRPNSNLISLETIDETYHEYRRQLMLARQEGLTATYNRFHNPQEQTADIQRLRELHLEMDDAVAAAYGWTDLELAHEFHETAQGIRFTISEEARREVLARLLRLNHERYEEEVRMGLHEKGKKKEGGARSEERGVKKKARKVREEGESMM